MNVTHKYQIQTLGLKSIENNGIQLRLASRHDFSLNSLTQAWLVLTVLLCTSVPWILWIFHHLNIMIDWADVNISYRGYKSKSPESSRLRNLNMGSLRLYDMVY